VEHLKADLEKHETSIKVVDSNLAEQYKQKKENEQKKLDVQTKMDEKQKII